MANLFADAIRSSLATGGTLPTPSPTSPEPDLPPVATPPALSGVGTSEAAGEALNAELTCFVATQSQLRSDLNTTAAGVVKVPHPPSEPSAPFYPGIITVSPSSIDEALATLPPDFTEDILAQIDAAQNSTTPAVGLMKIRTMLIRELSAQSGCAEDGFEETHGHLADGETPEQNADLCAHLAQLIGFVEEAEASVGMSLLSDDIVGMSLLRFMQTSKPGERWDSPNITPDDVRSLDDLERHKRLRAGLHSTEMQPFATAVFATAHYRCDCSECEGVGR